MSVEMTEILTKVAMLEASMSNVDIESYMRDLYKSECYPVFFTISGHDDDPRDLWQIPASLDLMKRMWEVGFVSLLRPNVPGQEGHFSGYFGAFQLWAVTHGITESRPVTGDDIRNFVADYREACDRGNWLVMPHDGQNWTKANP
jgi:hypothetical protein